MLEASSPGGTHEPALYFFGNLVPSARSLFEQLETPAVPIPLGPVRFLSPASAADPQSIIRASLQGLRVKEECFCP